MSGNYYVLLGVDSNATQDEIKSAYRRKVRELHPDHSGGGSEPFLAVQEAYEVLSDPARRRRYDDQERARSTRSRQTVRHVEPQPLRPRRGPVEPLVPIRRSVDPWDLTSGTRSTFPFEGVPRRSGIDLVTPIWPGTGDAEDVHVEVTLSPEQAIHGGRVDVWAPMQFRCPACRGQGGMGFFECPRCFGRGVLSEEYLVNVAYPAGVADGVTGSLRLRRPGMRDVRVTVRVRVHEYK